jgi:DNA-binding response OmpR family regulator
MLIVVVDDNPGDRDFARRTLQQQYHVESFSNAVDALQYLRDNGADVVLIDNKLQHSPDGLLLAKQTRILLPECVIVMISAFANHEIIIDAMRVGADDFILKGKVTPEQLIQWIGDAILRRRRWFPSAQASFRRIGDLEIDIAGHSATWHGQRLHLTGMEFGILRQLTSKPGAVVGFAELYFLITGEHINPKEARPKIKSHMTNLRQKLEQDGRYPQAIFSVYGKGFKWGAAGEAINTPRDDEADLA